MPNEIDILMMRRALELAQTAMLQEEVPVGAVITYQNEIIAEAWNQPIATHDPTAHAEIIALRQAAQHMQNYRLVGTTLYVTLEPCAMCLTAMVHARIERLVFGALDPKTGAVRSVFNLIDEPKLNHRIRWTDGIMSDECGEILKHFFRKKR